MEREASLLSLSSRYLVLESIGAGGMGVVVKAHDCVLKIDVAIKMLGKDPSGVAAARLQREATAAGRLSHPNIARVLDFGQWQDGNPYMVMEYVDGKSLCQLIKDQKHLPEADAIPIFMQIANAMCFAHNNNIIHRDLKPSNVILKDGAENESQVKILDFGVARILDEQLELTQKGAIVGSPLYLSPEQADGDQVTKLSDIYSFGCLMFEVLTGEPPFKGASAIETLYMHKNVAAPLVTDLISVQSVSRELVDLVDECLRKGPLNRPADFEAISQRLLEINQNLDCKTLVKEKKDVTPSRQKIRFEQILSSKVGLFSLVLIVVAGLVFVFSIQQTQNQKIEQVKMEVKADNDLPFASPEGEGKFKSEHLGDLVIKQYAKELIASSDQFCTDRSLEKLSKYKVNTLKCNAGTFTGSGLQYLQKPYLRSIYMLYSQLSDESLLYLTQFPNLNTVKVGSDSITNRGVENLTALKNLSVIQIESRQITSKISDSLLKLPLLQEVSVTSPNLDAQFIEKLSGLKKLRDLELGGTPLSDNDFRSIAKLKDLRVLRLGQSDFDPRSLRYLANNPNLHTLDLSNSQNISDELIENLILLKIEKVLLSHSNLNDRHLLKLSRMRNLKFIRLTGCHFTDDALDAFENNFKTMWKRNCDYDASIVN